MTKPEDTLPAASGSPLDVGVRQHTPGPWRAKPHGVVVGGAEIALPRGSVQQQVAMVCTIDDGDRDANARLIEAAPDLLDVVQALVFLVHGRSTDPAMILAEDSPLMDAARDALRKVNGAA